MVTVTASIPVTALANVLTNIIRSLLAQKETLTKDKRNKIKDKRKTQKFKWIEELRILSSFENVDGI